VESAAVDQAADEAAIGVDADKIICNGSDHNKLGNDVDETTSTSSEDSRDRVEEHGIDNILDHQENGIDDVIDHQENGIEDILDDQVNGIEDILDHQVNGIDDVIDHELLVANDSLKAYGSL